RHDLFAVVEVVWIDVARGASRGAGRVDTELDLHILDAGNDLLVLEAGARYEHHPSQCWIPGASRGIGADVVGVHDEIVDLASRWSRAGRAIGEHCSSNAGRADFQASRAAGRRRYRGTTDGHRVRGRYRSLRGDAGTRESRAAVAAGEGHQQMACAV